MAITLTYNGTTAHLSERLLWPDEFTYTPVVQSTAWSTTGALLVDVGVRQAGRPITLQGTETAAWVSRSLCETLSAWAALPGITLVLVVRGTARPVLFDHQRGGFDASPIWRLQDGEETPDQLFVPTLRFLEI